MNKKERMTNALTQKSVDRPPVGFWHHYDGDEKTGQRNIDAQIKFYRDANLDFMKIMSDGFFGYPLPEINCADDWYKVEPLPNGHPYYTEQVDRCKAISKVLKEECFIYYSVFAPFSSIRFGSSDEIVMAHLKENKGAVMHALDSIAKTNAKLCEKAMVDGGCDGIYYCMQGGEEDRFTYDEYRELVTPSEMYVINHINSISQYNILHFCGWAGDKNRLSIWQDYPAAASNWAIFVENVDLVEGRELFTTKTVLGGFDNTAASVLFSNDKQEVMDFTTNLIEKTGTMGTIIGADCAMPAAPVKQINWIIEAVTKASKN